MNSPNAQSETRKYAIFGFFGGFNSGDEAILETVIRNLRSLHPNADIVAICPRIRSGYAPVYESMGIRVVPANAVKQVRLLLRTHQLIVGGGQIITGDRSYKGLLYLWWLHRIAASHGRKPYMVGIGVEGVQRRLAKWIVKSLTGYTARIGCRDEYSLNMLRSAGCDDGKLKLTADVVLSSVFQMEKIKTLQKQERPIAIGLHHSPVRTYAEPDFYQSLVKKIRLAFPERSVVLVSNDSRTNFDAGLLNHLTTSIDDPLVGFQHFDSLEDVVKVYAHALCVVSVRMHPLILALIHEVPVVGVKRSKKVEQLSSRVGFPLYCPLNESNPSSDSGDLIKCIKRAIQQESFELGELPNLAKINFLSV
ncbi:polysaccharide pyruvyl transferase family protein [Rhodopirellula halodulae]|uniref:polysaccharide pyruvyl transferase family protein n=1 Tax=Rhodopirellula halodulae TaxID=2894198 RepID=UPI001E479D64|nr:polysaccharide pyruvyl transferase family protein [Rhodopirellula sp. JC737]MCC9654431.1 polysaccharide pyruvyl transferase family protein [Rhodopirellula sp. JC737]